MPSNEYNTLLDAINELKADLMDFSQNPIDSYSDKDILKCQAFVVFSHAEMQVYWESIARRILSEAQKRWETEKTMDRVIGTLLAFRRPNSVAIPLDPTLPSKSGNIEEIVGDSIRNHSDIINKNNGIKRANISEMFIPLGILPSDFSEQMLIQLDQTGKKRGDIVHKARKNSIRTIRDPFSDEMKDIYYLLDEINNFDKKLNCLGFLQF